MIRLGTILHLLTSRPPRGCVALLGALLLAIPAARAETVLRVAMTATDIPLTTGQPDNGAEGVRFMGITLYDGLLNWDLSHADRAAVLVPGLASEWSASKDDQRVWTFKLRPNVKLHDGSPWNADLAVWNLDKLLKQDAPQYDRTQVVQAGDLIGNIASYHAVDPMTLEIVTKQPDSIFPYFMVRLFFGSKARFEEMGRDWNKVAAKPAGTGPWILDKLVAHERAELVRNPNYWDPARMPKVDRVVLLPVPDPSTRVAALLSGRVDWIEAPPPDTIDTIKRAGMQVVTNTYPHIWPYMLSTLPGSPFADVRVRKAATLAISREGLVQLLNGTAMPARGMVTEGHPWFGTPTFRPTYDPEGAKKLLAEAGFGLSKPVKVKIGISSSGSGQMQPLPMNELIQQNLKEVGIDAEFAVFEWEALRARRRGGAKAPESAGLHAINNSWPFWDPWIGILGISMSSAEPPVGYNWGYFKDSEIDKLGAEVRSTFDIEAQNKLLQIMHARMVDQASWVWIVHDLNPRAMSPKVKGFVQAQNWYQDLTPVRIEP